MTTIILIILIVLALMCVFHLIYNSKKNSPLVKFYQIWLKHDELSSNFFVISGIEKKNKLISHNGIKFHKTQYTYAILPFANLKLSLDDLSKMSEEQYLNLCLEITKNICDE